MSINPARFAAIERNTRIVRDARIAIADLESAKDAASAKTISLLIAAGLVRIDPATGLVTRDGDSPRVDGKPVTVAAQTLNAYSVEALEASLSPEHLAQVLKPREVDPAAYKALRAVGVISDTLDAKARTESGSKPYFK